MKLSNREIIDILNALGEIKDKEMPILLTYKFVEITEKLYDVYSVYDKARVKAKNDEDIGVLLNETREVKLVPIEKQELIDAGVEITPAQLMSIRIILDG